MTRRKERETALCLIFNLGFHEDEPPKELFDAYFEYYPEEDEKEFFEKAKKVKFISQLYYGVAENIERIDSLISAYASNWKKERISRVSMAVLRMSMYELLYCDDIPYQVTINEAVELAKKYDHEDSYSFVNGVLGAAVKQLENDKARDGECEKEDE